MAKTSNRPRVILLLIAIGIVGLLAYVWLHKRHDEPAAPVAGVAGKESPVPEVPIDHIDPVHEGWVVSASGKLTVGTPARDTQLGVNADAVMLLRYAEMLQWREQCVGQQCDYKTVWSPQVINSRKFRVQDGHQNPERLPLTSARYSAGDLRLGAFVIDAAVIGNYRLGAALQDKPIAYPVTASQLPSNLAISFRDFNGILYAGNDPQKPAVGDMRVSYRIISAGDVQITGIQRGNRLMVQKSTVKKPQPTNK